MSAVIRQTFTAAFLSTKFAAVAAAPGHALHASPLRLHGWWRARSRAALSCSCFGAPPPKRAHSSIGQSPRLITGLFLVRTQVGPLGPLAPLAPRATADAPDTRWQVGAEGARLRLKRPRALCTFVPGFLHRPGVTH